MSVPDFIRNRPALRANPARARVLRRPYAYSQPALAQARAVTRGYLGDVHERLARIWGLGFGAVLRGGEHAPPFVLLLAPKAKGKAP